MMCEYLIVSVSSDESVQEYNNEMPVTPYEEAKARVKAIRYVDTVVPKMNRDRITAFEQKVPVPALMTRQRC